MPKGVSDTYTTKRRSQAARERFADMTSVENEIWHRNLSVGVREGLAAMSPEAKASMYKHISEGLNDMSEEDKVAKSKVISEGVRRSLAERNALIEIPIVPVGFGEWFTGFWEGDGGMCCMLNVNNLGSGYVFKPEIEFAQKDVDVVEYIASVLPGGILGWAKRKQGLYRQLRWSGQKCCIPVLKLLSQFVVSEVSCNKINTAMLQTRLPLVTVHEPTMRWVVGFWDAEGDCGISFSQNDVSLLYRISGYLGTGRVTEPVAGPRLTISGVKGRKLAVELLKYSCIERKKDMLRRRFGLGN